MISFHSEIEGKEAYFGDIEDLFSQKGFVLGGNWEFDGGYFDYELDEEKGETVYLRVPVQVVQGQLDETGARLKFLTPLLVRHVVETGVSHDDSLPLLDQMPMQAVSLVNQFQTPVETDGEIHNQEKRVEMAKEAIQRILPYVE